MKHWLTRMMVKPSGRSLLTGTLCLIIVAGSFALAVALAGELKEPENVHVTLTARRFKFSPATIEVNKGDTVTIDALSEDVTHGFFLDGYGINKEIRPAGPPSTVSFVADKTGKFNFRCSHTCGVFHPFMVGELIVTPNRRLAGSIGLAIGLAGASLFYIARHKDPRITGNPHEEPEQGDA